MTKLIPIIFLLLGAGVGGTAGFVFKPAAPLCEPEPCEEEAIIEEEVEEYEPNYLAMKNQFVVPVIQNELVKSLVVLSISLEIRADSTEFVFSREPKLRDTFLRVLFDHAHIGGFDGTFTESGRLSILRVALLESAQNVVGAEVKDILITDIVRQEM